MSTQEQELLSVRHEIDQIDQQLQTLFNQRACCAQKVANIKEKYQGTEDAVFYRPEREAQVLRAVMERNQGPLENSAVARLFREVMSVCLAHEKPLNIAYMGPAGAFSQLASHKHFGNSGVTVAVNSLDQVFREVDSGTVNYGIVPIENSTQGVATQTLDLFKRYSLDICGEVELSVQLHLYSEDQLALAAVKKVYALDETLSQCSHWLDQHCPQAQRIACVSSSQAQQLSKDNAGSAIIGADDTVVMAWQLVAQNISSENEHKARFLIIGRQQIAPSGLDKTSILVATQDKPGALLELLSPFQKNKISLTRVDTHSVESVLGADCSVFYIDFEGHHSDQKIKEVLAQLALNCVEIKILGSYPRAVL